MGHTRLRIVTTETANPYYDARLKRGWRSVQRFQTGLPLVVHFGAEAGREYFSYFSSISIDIPQLRLFGMTDSAVVQSLIAASADSLNQAAPPRHTPLIRLPADEIFLACGKCQCTQWLNVMRKSDHKPLRAVCARCGNVIIAIYATHSAGHA